MPFIHNPVTQQTLPPEVVERILAEAWAEDLLTHQRRALYSALCLVNHTWLDITLRTALRDVHISTNASANDYLELLPIRKPFWPPDARLIVPRASQFASALGRSLTFRIDANPARCGGGGGTPGASYRAHALPWGAAPSIKLYHADMDERAASAVPTVLAQLAVTARWLPGLRHVALEYVDWGFDDLFVAERLSGLPARVSHLALSFAYSDPALLPIAMCLQNRYVRHAAPGRALRWALPGVRHLAIAAAPPGFVADMLVVCPNVEVVELRDQERKLSKAVPGGLPAHATTLLLHATGFGLTYGKIRRWDLPSALRDGFFKYKGKEPLRIIVTSRWRIPDTVRETWEQTQKACARQNVTLIHARYPCWGIL